jgi:hypothetical protein
MMGGLAFGPQDAGPPTAPCSERDAEALHSHARFRTIDAAHEGFRSSVGQRAQTGVGGPASVAFLRGGPPATSATLSAARRIRLVA